MNNPVEEFWNSRYEQEAYIFGTEPNVFFKSVIDTLKPGKIFIPGTGEGRDAVYAAQLGWEVFCADLSSSGKIKALKLAQSKNVSIHYDAIEINKVSFPPNSFDAVASVFFHLPVAERESFHRNVINWLKNEGHFFLESFTPAQLPNTSGGPKDINMLVTSKQLNSELKELEIIENQETVTILAEGLNHVGKANVVRFIGRKK